MTVRAAPMNHVAMPQAAGVLLQNGDDLAFVARMLGDAAAVGPTSAVNTYARRATHKRNIAASTNLQEAHPSNHSQVLVNRHNKPSNRSSDREYHCEACDCSVPARERDWEVHTSGIKHKRQLVSLLHTGKLGSRVVSLFEAEPVIDEEQSAEWLSQFRLDYGPDLPKLKKARTEVMKGLLNLGGNSNYTQRIAEHYAEPAFCHTWAAASQKLAEQVLQSKHVELSLSADELVCVTQLLPDHRHIQFLTVTGLSHAGSAEADSEDQHHAWKCMEDAIAISMLLATCKSLHRLESVAVKFQHVGTLHQTVRDRIPRKDPFHDISRMYGHVWFDLQDLLRSSLALREVRIALSCQYPWNVNMLMLKEAAHHGHSERTATLTQSVLMGAHKRLGAQGHLRHLPSSVLQNILTVALPRCACQVLVATADDSWATA